LAGNNIGALALVHTHTVPTNSTGGFAHMDEVMALINMYGAVGASRVKSTVPGVIRALSALPSDLADAMSDLHRAIPRDYQTPCSKDPEAWDAVPITHAGGREFNALVFQLQISADACLDCKVFLLCRKVGEANRAIEKPPIVGIIAGELHDESSSGAILRSAMEDDLKWTA
jgi:hypothetical protein